MSMFETLLDHVTHARWETILPGLPDQSIDLVITDPPYNVSQPDITLPNKAQLGGNAFHLDFGR